VLRRTAPGAAVWLVAPIWYSTLATVFAWATIVSTTTQGCAGSPSSPVSAARGPGMMSGRQPVGHRVSRTSPFASVRASASSSHHRRAWPEVGGGGKRRALATGWETGGVAATEPS
jgi:hypothetical protein